MSRRPLSAANLVQVAALTALALCGVVALAYAIHAGLGWLGL